MSLIPSLIFQITTAFAILRHNGVIQRNIAKTLKPALPVPVGDAVADAEKRS